MSFWIHGKYNFSLKHKTSCGLYQLHDKDYNLLGVHVSTKVPFCLGF